MSLSLYPIVKELNCGSFGKTYLATNTLKTIIIALAATLAVSHPSIASPSCEKILYACSTSNNVRIRDAETFKILGKLNRGKCMETKCAYTIDIVKNNVLYYRTINSQSRRESLVPARYIKLVEGETQNWDKIAR